MLISRLEGVLAKAHSPLHRMEHALAPYVAFVIMPVFAFFNAGVAIGGIAGGLISAVSLGAFAGLLLGKPLGVTGFVFLAVRSGLTRLPAGASWPAMWASACWPASASPCRCSSPALRLPTRRC